MNGARNGAVMPLGHGWGDLAPNHGRYTNEARRLLKEEIANAGGIAKIDNSKARQIAEKVADEMRGRIDEFWE